MGFPIKNHHAPSLLSFVLFKKERVTLESSYSLIKNIEKFARFFDTAGAKKFAKLYAFNQGLVSASRAL